MPNETELERIKINANGERSITPKCPNPNFQWTEWSSYTDLSDPTSDGNDYEMLERHRSINLRYFILYKNKMKTIFQYLRISN